MNILQNMGERTPYNQIRRTMAVLRVLCMARGPMKIEHIIERLSDYGIEPGDRGLHPRNIHRDLAFLRDEMEYQIENIRGRGYLLHAREEVLPLIFTKEELQALCLGRELFTPFAGTHLGEAIEGVYKKITKIYKKSEHTPNKKLEDLENAFLIHTGPMRRYEIMKDKTPLDLSSPSSL